MTEGELTQRERLMACHAYLLNDGELDSVDRARVVALADAVPTTIGIAAGLLGVDISPRVERTLRVLGSW